MFAHGGSSQLMLMGAVAPAAAGVRWRQGVVRSVGCARLASRCGGDLHHHGENHLAHLGRIDNVREQTRFPSCAIRLEEFEGVLGCETGWDGIIFHPYI
jgi:hypothetical protein